MTGDNYRTVTATFRGIAPSGKAFFVDSPNADSEAAVPRSLIHAADDKRLDDLFDGEEFTFRLRAWKAEELGLA